MLRGPTGIPQSSARIEALVVWMAEQPSCRPNLHTEPPTGSCGVYCVVSYGVGCQHPGNPCIAQLWLTYVGHVDLSLKAAAVV